MCSGRERGETGGNGSGGVTVWETDRQTDRHTGCRLGNGRLLRAYNHKSFNSPTPKRARVEGVPPCLRVPRRLGDGLACVLTGALHAASTRLF